MSHNMHKTIQVLCIRKQDLKNRINKLSALVVEINPIKDENQMVFHLTILLA